jgi:S1-C subfamily serine protease
LALIVGFTTGLAAIAPAQSAPARAMGTLEVSAALRTGSLQVLPVALSRFALVALAGDTVMLATGRDGTGSVAAPAGDYTFVSLEAIEIDGSRYRWSLPATVRPDTLTHLDLSNLNATVEQVSALLRRPSGSGSAESEIFRMYGASVVRVEAGLGHGSGFIADTLGGVILTNAHVIGNAGPADVSVILDSLTRVEAQILARDNDADVAILRVASKFLQGRPQIPLGQTGDGAIVPGDRLVALGYPLSQGLTMTTGVASGIRDGAIISDVNINPGNSGGPLLTLDGNAIALNTFMEQDSHGPGVSGSILVSRAAPALHLASQAGDTLPQPSDTALSMMPRTTMSAAGLRAAAEAIDYKQYTRYSAMSANGRFVLGLQTPLATFVDIAHYEHEVGKDRKKREAAAGMTEDQRYSEMKQYRDWVEYVGDITTPVVSLVVRPDVGETGGSVFGRILTATLVGVQSQAKYKFKGDVSDVRLVVGDSAVPVRPLRGGHGPVSVWQEDRWVQLKDVADLGYYVYDPEAFRPAADGTTPVMVVMVNDLKHPGRWSCRVLPKEEVARVWNDFEDYYREHRSDRLFNAANAKAKVETGPIQKRLGAECEF